MPFLGLIAAVALADATPQSFVLETPLDVWDVAEADVNGDGMLDIVAYCSDADAVTPTKELAIFLADAQGRFRAKPTLRHELRSTNGTVFFAQYDGEPGTEVIESQQDRVTVWQYDGTQLAALDDVPFDSLLPNGSREPLYARDVSHDLDGDGVDEWLIPTPRGIAVMSQGRIRAEVPSPTSSEFREYGNMAIVHRLPAVTSFALPGEPLRAIGLLSDRYADFSFGPEWSRHIQFAIPIRSDENWDASAALEDIDADGYPDLVVTQTSGTVNLKVLTQIYFADGPVGYPDKSDVEFTSTGSFTTVETEDVDGDGKRDLIMVRIPLGVGNIISYFLRKRVTIEVAVHYFRDGHFGKKPDRTASITIDAPDGREQSAYATGDFDGDGRLDVAIGTAEDQLVFYQGAQDSFLSSRPWITMPVPTFGVARAVDLNKNGADDLVLHHPSGDNRRRIELVVF